MSACGRWAHATTSHNFLITSLKKQCPHTHVLDLLFKKFTFVFTFITKNCIPRSQDNSSYFRGTLYRYICMLSLVVVGEMGKHFSQVDIINSGEYRPQPKAEAYVVTFSISFVHCMGTLKLWWKNLVMNYCTYAASEQWPVLNNHALKLHTWTALQRVFPYVLQIFSVTVFSVPPFPPPPPPPPPPPLLLPHAGPNLLVLIFIRW